MPRAAKPPHLKFVQKRGVFYIQWSIGGGRNGQRSTGTADKAMASAALNQFMADEYPAIAVSLQTQAADRRGYVYFIGGDVGAIKIGWSYTPELRLKSLQCGSPIPLRLLAVREADRHTEWLYHNAHFHKQRLHGEWFDRSPELLAEIEQINRM